MPDWIDAATLAAELQNPTPPVVLDVREPKEWGGSLGVIEGATLRSSTRIHEWLDEITARRDESFVVLCHTHGRSAQVAYILHQEGHPDVRVLRDGMLNWSKSGFPHVTWNG